MFDYCVRALGFSEDSACKRIRAARAARQFPALLAAVAEGRLHLSAVVMLAPHLLPENAGELIAAAAGKRKFEVEQLLAERFPRPDLPTRVQAIVPSPTPAGESLAWGPGAASAPGRMEAPAERATVTPLAPERFALQFTISRSTYDKLCYAQELLSHRLAPGDVATVFERALDTLIP